VTSQVGRLTRRVTWSAARRFEGPTWRRLERRRGGDENRALELRLRRVCCNVEVRLPSGTGCVKVQPDGKGIFHIQLTRSSPDEGANEITATHEDGPLCLL
jgi:hypothetical protein